MDGYDVRSQLSALRCDYPELHRCIDPAEAENWIAELSGARRVRDDFGAEEAGGRGGSYRHAQAINLEARSAGIAELFGLIRADMPDGMIVADMLGGDGLVRRVCSELGIANVNIITCDASAHMVEAAWANCLPALLQRAERPLFRSMSLDAVLFAYGTHHIPRCDRLRMVQNAYRVLRPRGRMVLHDFAVGSPADTWFRDVVHPYSGTGHHFDHFTVDEMEGYLATAGFGSHAVMNIDDPYTAIGDTPEAAALRLGEYLVDMYGLVRLRERLGEQDAFRWAARKAAEIFKYPEEGPAMQGYSVKYMARRQAWQATLPRKAIVGVGLRT